MSDTVLSNADAPTLSLREHACNLLRHSLNQPTADFREGQWDVIEALVNKERLLVVQRTGWGKSVLYFLTTRLLRERNAGPTLLISPLLSLMRNQIQAAKQIGVEAATINSDNKDEWDEIKRRLLGNEISVLLISPERLSNVGFRRDFLSPIAGKIGLLAVDEAHCISDWGHDFRPDYQRIPQILPELSANVPILCTTATANQRVTDDVLMHFGNGLRIHRGTLSRDSLCLQNIEMPDPETKMAWLAKYLPTLPGSGIVYVLTRRTADRVAAWLQKCGIEAFAYYSGEEGMEPEERERLENCLLENKVKALVATSALGMGFDKPDLGFVVHFQIPGSVVHYYQQVGRAGRSINPAYGILLSSPDDEEINDYFIENALPPEAEVHAVLNALDSLPDGHILTHIELQKHVNLSEPRIKRLLKLLLIENPPPVAQTGKGWKPTRALYSVERYGSKVRMLQERRQHEKKLLLEAYLPSSECLMDFLMRELGDERPAYKCGRCARCRGLSLIPGEDLTGEEVEAARGFLRPQPCDLVIKPRRRKVPLDPFQFYAWLNEGIPPAIQAIEGRALCAWDDPLLGRLVARGYRDGCYDDQLIHALVNLIREWKPDPFPSWITFLPSATHPGSLAQLAAGLGRQLGIEVVDCIHKIRATAPQQDMANAWHQAINLDGTFKVVCHDRISGPVLVIDDVVKTGWTFTVIAALLRREGSGPVIPLALARRR